MALTLTTDDLNAIADYVWDEVLTGATHNVVNSAGRKLRSLITATGIVFEGLVVSGTSNTIVLDSGASSIDGTYDPSTIFISAGKGIGQCRNILEYTGSTQTAIVDRDWRIIPDATSEFVIVGNAGREHVNEGLARGGTNKTITLNANASDYDDAYLGQVVFLRSGTGQDQARRISAYDGSTKIATVITDWDENPDATTGYVLLPTGSFRPRELSDIMWTDAGSAVRTLTSGANLIASTVRAGDGVAIIGDSMSLRVIALGSLANVAKLYFTVKEHFDDDDSGSIIQIEQTQGLLYLNGATGVAGHGSISIDDAVAGDITVALVESDSLLIVPTVCLYDVKIIRSAGTVAETLATGKLTFQKGITKAVS